ncbi:MAG: hypothetical protein ACTINR_05010, partial [Leuconostoc mesenteroides]
MRLHRCAEIGCHELIKLGFDYCDKHYQSRMNSYRDRLKQSQELKSQTALMSRLWTGFFGTESCRT